MGTSSKKIISLFIKLIFFILVGAGIMGGLAGIAGNYFDPSALILISAGGTVVGAVLGTIICVATSYSAPRSKYSRVMLDDSSEPLIVGNELSTQSTNSIENKSFSIQIDETSQPNVSNADAFGSYQVVNSFPQFSEDQIRVSAITPDPKEFIKSKEAKTPQGCYEMAISLYHVYEGRYSDRSQEEIEKAEYWFKKADKMKGLHIIGQAAQRGDPRASFILGFIMYHDIFISRYRNYSEIAHVPSIPMEEFFRRAAEKGHPKAKCYMGFLCHREKKLIEAEKYYKQAASYGGVHEIIQLGSFYYYYQQNISAAKPYYSAVANSQDKYYSVYAKIKLKELSPEEQTRIRKKNQLDEERQRERVARYEKQQEENRKKEEEKARKGQEEWEHMAPRDLARDLESLKRDYEYYEERVKRNKQMLWNTNSAISRSYLSKIDHDLALGAKNDYERNSSDLRLAFNDLERRRSELERRQNNLLQKGIISAPIFGSSMRLPN